MTPPAASSDVRRARRTYAVVAVWVPVLLTTVAVILLLTWLPQVPATVATHWGRGGEPDGFAPAWSVPLLTAAVGYGLAALFGVIALGTRRSGEWGPTLRFLGALSCGTTAFLLVLVTVSFAMQRGLADASDAPSIGLPLIAGLVSGAIAGAAGWFAQPAVAVSGGSVEATVSAVALTEGERAAWLRTTTMSRPAMVAIAGVTLLMAVLAVVFGVAGGELWWLFAALALLFAVLAAIFAIWKFPSFEAQAELGSAYAARVGCSCRYVQGRSLESCQSDFEPGMEMVSLSEDSATKTVTGSVPLLASRSARYAGASGCLLRPEN